LQHGKVVIPLFYLPYEEKFMRICGGRSGKGSLRNLNHDLYKVIAKKDAPQQVIEGLIADR
jgi:hypothetical protein